MSGVAGANGVVSGSSVSEGLIGGVAVSESETERLLESVPMVLTQPGTPVSF